ncbi:FAD-dependent oxidoreductase [Acidisoma cellulosilytica]|uniref:FAD-dependent oxidoreductase n=2 Tax=Acidisoma cellulosilyticum TaxID=2802395 RepID=A0A964E4S3_9PROT|nr:FAD-dependent oxidoreductase [Acidisoma cellulosilyticum]
MIDVAIIGSGPAGLSAAIALRKRGLRQVVVLERDSEAGGVPRHCAHPPYGLREFGRIMTGPSYAQRLADDARAIGVQIRLLHSVTQLLPDGVLEIATPNGRQRLQAKRVLIATGVRETPRSARLLSGDRPLGVLNTGALQAYIALQGLIPFRRPVILGSELVSLSAIATCRSHGIRPAAVIETNARPTARFPLTLLPRLLGIPVFLGCAVTAIHGTDRVEAVTLQSTDGGTTRDIACDGVLLTGRFLPEASLIRASHLTLDPATQGPAIDQFGRCSDPRYFAAGNILRAVETAGWSFREGQRIAHCLAADLEGRLPSASASLEIRAGDNLKLVLPQRLTSPSKALGKQTLELRVAQGVTGRLRLRHGDVTLYERPLTALPERRILIPIGALDLANLTGTIVAEILT